MGRIKQNKEYRRGYICIGIHTDIYVCEFNISLKILQINAEI